jgi:MFS family permease
MLCLGRSIQLLVAGRLLQGASAAVVWTVALALLSDTVGKEESGQALGYVAMSYSLGVLVAPLLGGVVYDKAGYYAVFAMTFAVIALDIVLRLLIIEKKAAAKWLQSGQHVQASGSEQTEMRSPSTPSANTAVSEKATATALLRQTSDRSPKRKLPAILILLKSPRILAAFWGNFVAAASIGAFDATLPIFVNRTFGWNSFGAGLIFIAIVVPSFAGPLIGMLLDPFCPSLR